MDNIKKVSGAFMHSYMFNVWKRLFGYLVKCY